MLSSKETYTITAPKVQSIELNLDEILFIVSDDNYVDIHLLSNGQRKKVVFRSSLKNIENQIVNPISPMYRCHRRYLVNINYFEIKNKKSRKASIALKKYADEVPVSSTYERSILDML
jgi:DNA-binding LytR/AlgR family response regulator